MRKAYNMFWGFKQDSIQHEFTSMQLADIQRVEGCVSQTISEMVETDAIDMPYRWLGNAYGYNGITDEIIDNLKEDFSDKFSMIDVLVRFPASLKGLKRDVDRAFDIIINLRYADNGIELVSEGLVTIDQGLVTLQESY